VDLILEKPITASDLFNAYQNIAQPNSIQYKGQSEQALQGIRLLVVDDNEFNREVAVLSFESEGAKVITLNDGQEAVSWLKSNASEVDLILMDVQMPVMDGYQATQAIRKELKLEVPIVALTAGAFEQHKQAALDSGMDDFIAKPFEIDQSISVITKWVRRSESPESMQEVSSLAPEKQSSTSNEFDTDFFNLQLALTYWKTEEKLKKYLVRFKAEYLLVDEQMSQLEPAAAEQLAHKLKGASAVLGLQKISHQAMALMDVYNAVSHESADQLLVELKAILDETWSCIDQYTQ
jgi:CheY-like chemotaxis protein/HPt (histidine-containing phosphotransfer) domain-containing protein